MNIFEVLVLFCMIAVPLFFLQALMAPKTSPKFMTYRVLTQGAAFGFMALAAALSA